MDYSLKNIVILRAKAVTFRCLLMGTRKNEALKLSVTYAKGVLEI